MTAPIRIEKRLFMLGFAWTLLQLPLGFHMAEFGTESIRIARSLYHYGRFSDPFGSETGPTALLAPVYPAILAALLKLFANSWWVLAAVFALNAAWSGTAASLMPALSERVYGSAGAGVIGGVLLALNSAMQPQWEGALWSALLVIAVLVALRSGPAISGLWMGAAVLTGPTSILVLAPVALRRGLRFAALALSIAIAICVPWIVRDWIVLGHPYFVRDSMGMQLWVSNNDMAGAELVKNPSLLTLHPNLVEEQRQLMKEMGEPAYYDLRMRDALDWIRSQPRRFLELCAKRVFYFWFPSRTEGWQAYGYWAITVLGAAGAWMGRRNAIVVALVFAAVAYSLPFVLIETDLRYRFPELWITALLAGQAIHATWIRVRPAR